MPIRKYNPLVETRFYIATMIIFIISYYSWLYIWRSDQLMKTLGSSFFGLCGFVMATICLYYVYTKARGTERIFWYLIFLSCSSFIIAQIIWSYYDLILEAEVPFPGLSDFFYLLQPTLILFSILNIIYKRENIFISFRLFLDILITMTVVVALSWYFLIQPVFLLENETILFKSVALAYPISDLGLIFGVLGLNATSKIFSRNAHYTLLMGLTLFCIADFAFFYLSTRDSYHTGSIFDPLWILASLLIGLAGLYSTNQIEKTETADMKHMDIPYVFSFTRSILPYFSMFLLLLIVVIRIWELDSLIIGLIFGIFLISMRQIVNLLDNKRLMLLLAQSNLELEISKKALEDKHEFLKKTSATIRLEAQTDYLTGLYNRRYIVQSLHRLMEQANLNNFNFSLFMLDIDHFKQINDQFGHDAGDNVLQQVTQIMLKNTRCEEKIGRFGGEEFVGFLPGVVEEEAEMIAERIRKQIVDHTFLIGSQKIKVTVSIGVSQWRANSNDDVQSLLKRIDKALYKAKGKGRNCTVVL